LESAGAHPSPVHPYAVKVLEEFGADTGLLRSKHLDELSDDFLHDLDFVITFCPDDVCPIKLVNAKKIHWPMPDPLAPAADENEQTDHFRHTLQHIKIQLVEFGREYGVLKGGAAVH
jgi:arsenate reductase